MTADNPQARDHEHLRLWSLRSVRIAAGLSPHALSRLVATKVAKLHEWEEGHPAPPGLAEDLARVLGTTVETLVSQPDARGRLLERLWYATSPRRDTAEQVALVRRSTGLSPTKFAREIGAKPAEVLAWERGLYPPAGPPLVGLAELHPDGFDGLLEVGCHYDEADIRLVVAARDWWAAPTAARVSAVLSEAQRDEMYERYAAGDTITSIARALKVSPHVVSSVLKRDMVADSALLALSEAEKHAVEEHERKPLHDEAAAARDAAATSRASERRAAVHARERGRREQRLAKAAQREAARTAGAEENRRHRERRRQERELWGPLPRDVGDRVCELYQADPSATVASVSAELGVSASAVYSTLRARGVPRRRGRPRPPPEATLARAQAMADAYEAGATLDQLAERFGLSRERVRQLLAKYHPGHIAAVRAARRAQQEREKRERHEARLVERQCPVCGDVFLTHLKQRTCGNEDCAWLWERARIHFDWRYWAIHKLALARTTVRSEPAGSKRRAQAEELLAFYEKSGAVPGPNRVFMVSTSETWRRLVRRLGEDGARERVERRRRESAAMQVVVVDEGEDADSYENRGPAV